MPENPRFNSQLPHRAFARMAKSMRNVARQNKRPLLGLGLNMERLDLGYFRSFLGNPVHEMCLAHAAFAHMLWEDQPDSPIFELSNAVVREIASHDPVDLDPEWLEGLGIEWSEARNSDGDDIRHKSVLIKLEMPTEALLSYVPTIDPTNYAGLYVTWYERDHPENPLMAYIVPAYQDNGKMMADVSAHFDCRIGGFTGNDPDPDPDFLETIVGVLPRMLHQKKIEYVTLDHIPAHVASNKKKMKAWSRRRKGKITIRKQLSLVHDPPPSTIVERRIVTPRTTKEHQGGGGWHQRPHWRDEGLAIRWVKDPAGREVHGFRVTDKFVPLYAVKVPIKRHKRGRGEPADVTTVTTITPRDS